MFFKFISTVCFLGYAPFAPGTLGTLAAFPVMFFLRPSLSLHIMLTLFVLAVGTVASDYTEKSSGRKDPQFIVIDEFAGYIASLLFLPLSLKYMIGAFILFRIFDIIKPPPIKKIEAAFKGGVGVMADDIMAAIYTNIILQAWKILS